jgi:DNA invertase Pin-like site-specific DNA recombinase
MQVALYARVSTTKQAQNDLSLPNQLSQMRANTYLTHIAPSTRLVIWEKYLPSQIT